MNDLWRRSSRFSDPTLREKGDQGERAALDFFAAWTPDARVEDVRDDPAWQRREVDYRLHFSRRIRSVEVKSDVHIAKGNVLFELCRIHHTAAPEHCAYLSWGVFSAAERLLVWCEPAQRMYVFGMEDLRRGMQQYTAKTRAAMNLNIKITDQRRTTFNILVPLRYVPYRSYSLRDGYWLRDVQATN